MPAVRFFLVLNLDSQGNPAGLLSVETSHGSVVPVFTSLEAARCFLASPALRRLTEQSGPKGIIEENAPSFEAWLFRLRMLDRSTENQTYLLDSDPAWQALSRLLA